MIYRTTQAFSFIIEKFNKKKALKDLKEQILELQKMGDLKGTKAGLSAIAQVQAAEFINNPADFNDLSCRSGCSGCCSNYVNITEHEAEVIMEYYQKSNLQIDEAKLRRQAFYKKDNWYRQSFDERKCVFLNANGTCGIYPVRPSACRMMLVTSHPDLCRGERSQISYMYHYATEIIRMAILNISITTKEGSLPDLINQKVRKYHADLRLNFQQTFRAWL